MAISPTADPAASPAIGKITAHRYQPGLGRQMRRTARQRKNRVPPLQQPRQQGRPHPSARCRLGAGATGAVRHHRQERGIAPGVTGVVTGSARRRRGPVCVRAPRRLYRQRHLHRRQVAIGATPSRIEMGRKHQLQPASVSETKDGFNAEWSTNLGRADEMRAP